MDRQKIVVTALREITVVYLSDVLVDCTDMTYLRLVRVLSDDSHIIISKQK